MLAAVDCLELKVPQLRTFCWIFVLKNIGNVFGSAQKPMMLARPQDEIYISWLGLHAGLGVNPRNIFAHTIPD